MIMPGCGLLVPTHVRRPFSHAPETVDFSEVDDRVGFLGPWTLVRSAPYGLRMLGYGRRWFAVPVIADLRLALPPVRLRMRNAFVGMRLVSQRETTRLFGSSVMI